MRLVVVRQELRAVGGDVHVGRTLGLARLAGEAQVERLLDVLVVPRAVDHLALEHLEQHVRAAARAVLLFERRHVARAHGAVVALAALAHPDAAQRGLGEGAAVIGELEVCGRVERVEVGAKPQVFGRLVRVDQLVGIQLVPRIPDRLELAEPFHQLRTEHLGQQRAARLPVAVLARDRSAVMHDEVRRAVHELAVLPDARLAPQVEADLHVDAPVAEVAVVRSLVVVFVEEPAKIAEVAAELVRRDGGIVPALVPRRKTWRGNGGARARLADLPDRLRFVPGIQTDVRLGRQPLHQFDEALRHRVRRRRVVGAEFHQQQAAAFGNQVEVRRALAPQARRS